MTIQKIKRADLIGKSIVDTQESIENFDSISPNEPNLRNSNEDVDQIQLIKEKLDFREEGSDI